MHSDSVNYAVANLNFHGTLVDGAFTYSDFMRSYASVLHVSSPWVMYDGDMEVSRACPFWASSQIRSYITLTCISGHNGRSRPPR